MEHGKLPEPVNVQPGTRTLPFEIDLNETPLSSPRETLAADEAVLAAAKDGVFTGNFRGNLCCSCGRAEEVEGEMLACCNCGRGFHMRCLGTKEDQKSREWKCFKCLLTNGSERLPSRVGLLDINASPPREADGEGFLGDVLSSGTWVQCRDEDQSGYKIHTVPRISFIGRSAPMTTSNMLYLENGSSLHGVTRIPKSGFKDLTLCRLDRTSEEADFSSTHKGVLCSSPSTPMNFLPKSQSEVYLQALREYIQDKQGLLGLGWQVKFTYCENRCKTIAVYCAPNGSKFESMPDVACYLGLLPNYSCFEYEDRSVGYASPKGLPSNRRRKEFLRFSKVNDHRGNQNSSRNNSAMGILSGDGIILSRHTGNFGSITNIVEADSMEHGPRGFELFQDVLPLQFEDFFVLSFGKVDPRPLYHSSCQIWPVGYKSCWHDKITGSIFVSEVVDGGVAGPSFKVRRYPCSTWPIPAGSTVLLRQKSESFAGKNEVAKHDSTTSDMEDDENPNIQMMLREESPPDLGDVDFRKSTCLTTESGGVSQPCVSIIHENFGLGDCIGEFLVEGGTSSLVWEMASQTFLHACHEVYKQVGTIELCCKHNANLLNVKTAIGIDSLSRFCYLSGPIDVPRLIHSNKEFDTFNEMLMKWLQLDRFGLDMDFVQEMLEQLPGVHSCSGYKFLSKRSRDSGSQTVRDGFLLAKRKSNVQDAKGADGFLVSRKRARKHFFEYTDMKKPFPLGKPLSAKLPSCLIGDVLQAWEFLWRFSEVLGLEEPVLFQELENELLNPWLDSINPLEGAVSEILDSGDFTFCNGAALTKAHSSLLKVVVGELLSKVAVYVDPSSDAGEGKSRRGRKKEADNSFTSKKIKFDMLQINELTWPELARRYILVVLSMEGNLDSAEIISRESSKIYNCLQGDGGILCGSLTGVAGMETDALLLAEATKQVFGTVKNNDFVNTDQDESDAVGTSKMIKESGSKVPEWAQALEPVRKLPTNVGARIRKCVYDALDKSPPDWAKKILDYSISKEVYKGNASGPTKRAIVSLLADVSDKDLQPKPADKKEKVKSVSTVSDLVMKQCRVVLRRAAAEDEEKVFCNLLGRTLVSTNDNDDEGRLGYPAMVSRPLDFRTIDIRLAAGAYGGSHEAFLEDVREVWSNIRTAFADRSDFVDLAETLSEKFENMYEKEVLTVVQKFSQRANSQCISDEAKKEMDDMLVQANERSLPKAPWDEGVCKVCGVDRDDDSVLLCDACDSEYHTYCLCPPLPRIPEGNWYCPSCVAGQLKSQGASNGTGVNWFRRKGYQGEFTGNFMATLSQLARTMKSKEYWEFSVEERIFLIKILGDEALNSSILRDHLDHCAYMSADLQQKLRLLSSECKNLKIREEIQAANLEKVNSVHNRVIELEPDGLLSKDGKLKGQQPKANTGDDVSCSSGNFSQPEDGQQCNRPNDYHEQPYWSYSKENSENTFSSRNQILRESGTVVQSVEGQIRVPENHFSHMHSGAKGSNEQVELAPSSPQQQKTDAKEENAWSPLSSQNGLKDSSGNGLLLTPTPVPQFLVSSDTDGTHMAENIPFVHVNSEHTVAGQHSSSQSDTSALQANNLEMSSLKHEISALQNSIAGVESELQNVSVRKEILGRDSAGRVYRIFGRPDNFSLMVANGNEVKHSKVAEQRDPSSISSGNVSSMYECRPSNGIATSAWVSYQSDTELGELIKWLREGDLREKELKESILQCWQRNKSKESKEGEIPIQREKKTSCLKLSDGGKATVSNYLVTNAVTALEKKYGACLAFEASDLSNKKVTCDGKFYRCDCLEPIYPSRHHCMLCHQTYSSNEELERHDDGMCRAGSSNPQTKLVYKDSQKGKRTPPETSVKKRHDDNGSCRLKGEKNEVGLNESKFQEPECPYNFEEISAKFFTQNSLKELVKNIGLNGSNGASFVFSASPCIDDPTLRLVTTRKGEINSATEVTDVENHHQLSTNRTIIAGRLNCDRNSYDFPGSVGNDIDEEALKVSNCRNDRNRFPFMKNKGLVNRCVIPESSLRRLVGRVSRVIRQLKINLLDMDAALPEEALRPSMAHLGKRSAWRTFVKSSGSIYEIVQATIVLENMIKADYLKREWWYWSSLSAAANISTLSALALRVYTLDSVILFEKPSSTPDSTEILKPGCEGEGGTPPNLNTTTRAKASSPLLQKAVEDDISKAKTRPSKRRKDSGG